MPVLPLFQILRRFLEMHLLLALGYGLFALSWRVARPTRAGGWVRLGQAIFVFALLLPLVTSALPKKILWKPHAQVWVGGARGHAPYALLTPTGSAQAVVATQTKGMSFTPGAMQAALALVMLAIAFALGRALWRRHRLGRCLRAQTPWKHCRRASLLLSSENVVPFSARWRGRAYVVLPASLLGTREARLAFRHEAIHHRRGDTLWVHGLDALGALLVGNPAAKALAEMIERLQELTVDELVVAGGICAHEYGRGLFHVAQWAQAPRPPGVHGLAAQAAPTFLRQRIERLVTKPSPRSRLIGAVGIGALATGMLLAAFALRSTVQDRWLTLSEASALAQAPSVIPLEANELVLARLNAFIGTPEGRAQMQRGLQRMPAYRHMIESRLKEFGVPEELIAIPLFESAFNNEARSPGVGAAGIWQFIAGTARRYGLVVDFKKRDERIMPERETVAAMHYLSDLYREFGDWRLAIKAYNEGEEHVRSLIRQTHSRDPWVLERASSPERYLSGAIATMILLKNPQIVE